MRNAKIHSFWAAMFVAVAFAALASANGEVVGVFGVKDIGEETAFALWVPLDSEQSVAGFRWYNNDSRAGFSEILAVAGVQGDLRPVTEAVSVGENVTGIDAGWSEVYFLQPLASVTYGC